MKIRKASLVLGASSPLGTAIIKHLNCKGISCLLATRSPKRIATDKDTSNVTFELDLLWEPGKVVETILSCGQEFEIQNVVFAQRFRTSSNDDLAACHDSMNVEILNPINIVRSLVRYHPIRSVLFLTSKAREYVCQEQQLSYHLTKSCLDMAIRYLAFELAGRNINVNALCLGYVKTEPKVRRPEGFFTLDKCICPTGRANSVSEIASAASALLELPACITGQIIDADSGVSLQSHTSLAESIRIWMQARRDV
jgi:NAD(P)-dependent dehydrogenase (short-subunit alcohol dehydrogenase family)